MERVHEFAYQVRLHGVLAETRERVVSALGAQGFGVLSEIDVQRTMKEKMGAEMAPYRILGICNPKLAHAALEVSPHVGLMLPCTVTLREDGDDTIVEILRPEGAMSVIDIDGVQPIAAEAEQRLEAAARAIEATDGQR